MLLGTAGISRNMQILARAEPIVMTAGAKSLAVFYHPTMQADGADVPTHTTHQGYRWLLGACWGVLLGSALQLQQAALSGMAVYVLAVLAGQIGRASCRERVSRCV